MKKFSNCVSEHKGAGDSPRPPVPPIPIPGPGAASLWGVFHALHYREPPPGGCRMNRLCWVMNPKAWPSWTGTRAEHSAGSEYIGRNCLRHTLPSVFKNGEEVDGDFGGLAPGNHIFQHIPEIRLSLQASVSSGMCAWNKSRCVRPAACVRRKHGNILILI